jgi:hypothetical protein
MKTYSALLLAVMVAGAATITSEAHAQSNTERLVSIDGNTDTILAIVTAMSDTLTSMQTIINELTGLSDDISTVTESSARVESAISDFRPNINSIMAGVQLNTATLNDLSNIMAGMSTDITSIQASLVDGGDGGLAKSIDVLTSTVNRNEVTTSDRLAAIEAAISRLEAKLDSTPSSVSPTKLTPGSETYEVTSYTYKSQGEKRTISGTDIYELDLTFSCDGPVNIDEVSTNISNSVTWIIPNSIPASTTPENYLKVEKQNLYHSRLLTSPGLYNVYNNPFNFGFEQLSVGQTLDFESRQTESGTRIDDSTRTAYHRGYTITVEYLGDRSTTCSFGDIGSPGTGSLPRSSSLLLAPEVGGAPTIKTFSVDVTCDDDPVEITRMTATVVDGWSSNLSLFSEFELTHLGSDKVVDIGFASDGTLNSYNYPIAFHSEDIRVSGTIASSEDVTLLIEIDYNTVTGGSCEEK